MTVHENCVTLEQLILWCVYAGALRAKKLRKFANITGQAKWQQDLVRVREMLEGDDIRL